VDNRVPSTALKVNTDFLGSLNSSLLGFEEKKKKIHQIPPLRRSPTGVSLLARYQTSHYKSKLPREKCVLSRGIHYGPSLTFSVSAQNPHPSCRLIHLSPELDKSCDIG
jgi:hypothetical protein